MYSRNNYPHCLQWEQLSTLSTVRPSKGGSLVALSHPFVYLCRLTSGGNCRFRKLSLLSCQLLSAVGTLVTNCRHILTQCRLSLKPLGRPLQWEQLCTLPTVGTAIHMHFLHREQLSTLSTVGTAIYTVYSYLHCLQWEQLSTLSTPGTAIHTFYSGNSCPHS